MSQVAKPDGSGTEYRQPQQETWYIQRIDADRNEGTLAAESFSANRERAKDLDKYMFINGKKVAKILSSGYVTPAIEYSVERSTHHTALKDALTAKGDTDWEDVEEGMPVFKTAEDDEGLYFHTSQPEGYEHESADPEEYETQAADPEQEEIVDVDGEWDGVSADQDDRVELETLAYPTPIRLGPHADLDDIEWGRTYDAEVNNAGEDYGVFVSLPDIDTPGAVTGLIPSNGPHVSNKDALDKLKAPSERGDGKGDSLVVAPTYRRATDGKWGFTVVDALDTHAHVTFDEEVPQEPYYVRQYPDEEPIDEDLARKALGIDKKPESTPEPQKIETGMSASPYTLHQTTQRSQAEDDTSMQQEATEPDAETDSEPEPEPAADTDEDTEKAPYPKAGSITSEFDNGHSHEEYVDVGESVDEDEAATRRLDEDVRLPGDDVSARRLDEAVEAEVLQHYADGDELNEAREELLWCLRQVYEGDLDVSQYIRLKLSEMDDDQTREFISVAAANEELGDDLFRKLVRELA